MLTQLRAVNASHLELLRTHNICFQHIFSLNFSAFYFILRVKLSRMIRIKTNFQTEIPEFWLVPIIQGYVAIESVPICSRNTSTKVSKSFFNEMQLILSSKILLFLFRNISIGLLLIAYRLVSMPFTVNLHNKRV